MKPSFTEQRDVPVTDRKFRQNDEHLVARDKEDVVMSAHNRKKEHEKRDDRSKFDDIHPSDR